MKKALGVLLPLVCLSLLGAESAAKTPDARVMGRFTSSDWPAVWDAKKSLESLQAEALPDLIALLRRDQRVKLLDTADLIYPGASEFYGHGFVVDYDIDWLAVRAGWALEELTLQAFGFREGAIDHDALLQAALAGQSDVPLSAVATEAAAEVKARRRAQAVASAEAWWAQTSGRWSRLAALRAALESTDPARQMTALSWLRYGTTRCDGLTKETFTRSILPAVRRLSETGAPDVKVQAAYLITDFDAREWYWLSLKGRYPQ